MLKPTESPLLAGGQAPDGSRAIVLRLNKRRRRIVNMPLTPSAEVVIDKARSRAV